MNWLKRLRGVPYDYKCGICGETIKPQPTFVTNEKGKKEKRICTVIVNFITKHKKFTTCPRCFYLSCEVAKFITPFEQLKGKEVSLN